MLLFLLGVVISPDSDPRSPRLAQLVTLLCCQGLCIRRYQEHRRGQGLCANLRQLRMSRWFNEAAGAKLPPVTTLPPTRTSTATSRPNQAEV